MSTRNSTSAAKSRSSLNQNNTKPQICTVKQRQIRTASRSRLEGTLFRLSKPNPIKSTVVSQSVTYEKYATRYFRDHPDEESDIRSAKEKLISIGEESSDFETLMQRKILCEIEYGELSPEVADSHISLGHFYRSTERPKSALRHLNEAKSIAQNVPLRSKSCAEISVEIAEIRMSQGGKKHVQMASDSLNEKYTVQTDEGEEEFVADSADIADGSLHFRRDLLKARIAKANGEECSELYATAEQTLADNEIEMEKREIADFHFEVAVAMKDEEKTEKIEKYARMAADAYRDVEDEDKALEAEALIPPPEEEEEEEKKENGEEEEKKEEAEKPEEKEGEEEDGEKRLGALIIDTLEKGEEKKEKEEKKESVTFPDIPNN